MLLKIFYIIPLLILITFLFWSLTAKEEINFNTQIRPILNKKCLSCHGGVKQNGGLALRFREEALKKNESDKFPIIPGNARKSEVYKRINHTDPEDRMPQEGDVLTKTEKNLIKEWINQGADWDTHWAYRLPDPNIKPPEVNSDWMENNIDNFVLKRLQNRNIKPSDIASKSQLLRRVYFDLVGLPPSLEEIEQFLNDPSPDAYSNLVDRLLQSPHFGERWAVMWLDLARYADSQGYQKDPLRPDMWRYRDWVIDAFNKDMPFDQFTIEQLAGDLIDGPTSDQLLATAFHRNTMTNDEGGTDDEEFRVAAVIDRTTTTMEVWQAATVACVQCHSHPYDPYQHEDFYRLYAFFNTSTDKDLPNDAPTKPLLSPAQAREKESLKTRLDQLRLENDTLSDVYLTSLNKFLEILPGQIPVMQELSQKSRRESYVFERGNWLMHGKKVQPGTPSFLSQLDTNIVHNRLSLAQWLTSPQNPLTSRVIVNRFWEQLFGRGIVETVEDFGTQGALPSHPELLDWLATQFQFQHQWSVKALLKQIVHSATYRQSSHISPELLEVDPHNRLLARGSRDRLTAEQIRDQALVVSNLWAPKVYGASVMPYQPDGVWNVIRHTSKWKMNQGADRFRRGIYTFWRRVSPYPSMEIFDSPSRELCTSRRISTNTPLQALVTLNDPVFTEASSALARRMLNEGGTSVDDQIKFGYRLLLMEDPSIERLEVLRSFYNRAELVYKNDEEKMASLLKSEKSKSAGTAAMVNLANILLNLDEVIMQS